MNPLDDLLALRILIDLEVDYVSPREAVGLLTLFDYPQGEAGAQIAAHSVWLLLEHGLVEPGGLILGGGGFRVSEPMPTEEQLLALLQSYDPMDSDWGLSPFLRSTIEGQKAAHDARQRLPARYWSY